MTLPVYIHCIIALSVIPKIFSMDYHALKKEASSKIIPESGLDSLPKTNRIDSPFLRICKEVESGKDPATLPALSDEQALFDFAAELFTAKTFKDEKNFHSTMHAVFLLKMAFLEKRHIKRSKHMLYLRTLKKITAEMSQLKEEIEALSKELSDLRALHTVETATLAKLEHDAVETAKKIKLHEKNRMPESLKTAEKNRAESCIAQQTSSNRFLESITQKVVDGTAQLNGKASLHHKLSLEHSDISLLAIEAIVSIASWDEVLLKMGLDFSGTVSPALMIDLIEEYTELSKLYKIKIIFNDESTESKFERIKSYIEFITPQLLRMTRERR